jgi:hypothetical protein
MAAPDITLATRFNPTGTTKYYWCPSIANKLAPTRAELNGGTNLSPDLYGVSGFTVKSEAVPVPDISNRFVGQIPGRITADDSSITMYMDGAGVDARSLMPQDTAGFVVRLEGGDTAGRKMDVFPVKVMSVSKENLNAEGNAAAGLMFSYSTTSLPAQSVTIPA